MGIKFENSLKVSPENAIVIDYLKTVQPNSMPQMHYHPYYEIYILVSGRRKYFFQNKILELEPQDVLVVKPNDAHRAIPVIKGPYERYIIDIDPTLFSKIEKYNKEIKDILKKNILHLNEDSLSRLLNTIKKIEREKFEDADKFKYSIRNHLERILIELLFYILIVNCLCVIIKQLFLEVSWNIVGERLKKLWKMHGSFCFCSRT